MKKIFNCWVALNLNLQKANLTTWSNLKPEKTTKIIDIFKISNISSCFKYRTDFIIVLIYIVLNWDR